MKRLSRAVLIALLFFLLPRGGVFAQTFPRAGGYVNDFAHVLRPDAVDRLRALTAEVKEKTGAELVVVTMPDIGGEDYTEYSNKLFSRWGIGEKGKENGVLIFLALRERKIRIEVGYGLEGILPDGLVGEILDTYAMPHLKQGDYSKGLYGAAIACAAIIAKDAGVMLNGVPRDLRGKRSQPAPPGSLLGSLVFFLFLLFIVLARSGLFPWIVLDGMSRRGGYSGFGGGFGGGGFGGGFGGFGGGMSGGGGAGRGF